MRQQLFRRPSTRPALAFALALCAASLATSAAAQDNILVYGNSIIQDQQMPYLQDIIVQSGRPAPNLVTFIAGNQTTTNYAANTGLITSSLPAGQTWEAVIVQGGTIEVTTLFGTDPTVFVPNMVSIAGAFFSHSPNGRFIGHETGADHPNSSRYPAWFPSADAWLSLAQTEYEDARVAVTSAYPSNPPAATIPQGTMFASTIGYSLGVFKNDLHHHSRNGAIVDALLHYQALYGGRMCDLNVDYSQSTPLVTRLLADGVAEDLWERLCGFVDRSLPASRRTYPGTEDDFQLRLGVNTTLLHTCEMDQATAGDTLNLLPYSPLGAASGFGAGVYYQVVQGGSLPAAGSLPNWYLDPSQERLLFYRGDLNGGAMASTIPMGLAGLDLWCQSISRMPSSTSSGFALSDAKVIQLQ